MNTRGPGPCGPKQPCRIEPGDNPGDVPAVLGDMRIRKLRGLPESPDPREPKRFGEAKLYSRKGPNGDERKNYRYLGFEDENFKCSDRLFDRNGHPVFSQSFLVLDVQGKEKFVAYTDGGTKIISSRDIIGEQQYKSKLIASLRQVSGFLAYNLSEEGFKKYAKALFSFSFNFNETPVIEGFLNKIGKMLGFIGEKGATNVSRDTQPKKGRKRRKGKKGRGELGDS